MARDPNKKAELGKKVSELRREAEERDAMRRAEISGYAYADLRKVPIALEAVKLISEAEAKEAKVAALEVNASEVALAAYDPVSPKTNAVVEGLLKKKYTAKLFTASLSGLEQAWRLYQFIGAASKEITGRMETGRLEELMRRFTTFQVSQEELGKTEWRKASTTDLFATIIAGALAARASDIHFEAEEGGAKVRFRIDGLLHDLMGGMPHKNYDALISRIKLLSGLKINVRSEPQDGRFSIALVKKEIEVRVSIIPAEFGETIVMRLLDPEGIQIGLAGLGLRPDDQRLVEIEIERPHGLILNTGPTGSGKTTTLYAFLKKIVTPEIKVITIEDPIEYHLAGVEQTQVDTEAGYTFASGLRAIVRQDPDAILVGEIRDAETADIALQAALTGHLVFSTLHTNDAVGAVPRLVNLGAKPASIGPALTLVIAQRLVRKLCAACRKTVPLSSDLQKKLKAFLEKLPPRVERAPYAKPAVYEAVGCEACHGFGYRGRIGIFEFLKGGTEIEEAILKEASEATMRFIAKRQEMVTMQEDGVLKVITGITAFSEVEDVTGPIEW